MNFLGKECIFDVDHRLMEFEELLKEFTSEKAIRCHSIPDIVFFTSTFENTLNYFRGLVKYDLITYDEVDLNIYSKKKIEDDILTRCNNLEKTYLEKLERELKKNLMKNLDFIEKDYLKITPYNIAKKLGLDILIIKSHE